MIEDDAQYSFYKIILKTSFYDDDDYAIVAIYLSRAITTMIRMFLIYKAIKF